MTSSSVDVQLVNQVTRAAHVEHDRCGRARRSTDRLIDPGAVRRRVSSAPGALRSRSRKEQANGKVAAADAYEPRTAGEDIVFALA